MLIKFPAWPFLLVQPLLADTNSFPKYLKQHCTTHFKCSQWLASSVNSKTWQSCQGTWFYSSSKCQKDGKCSSYQTPEMVAPSVHGTGRLNKLNFQPSQAKTSWSQLYSLISVCTELNWIIMVSIKHSCNISFPSGNKESKPHIILSMGWATSFHLLSSTYMSLLGWPKHLANGTVKQVSKL